jgi:hypothetical protein
MRDRALKALTSYSPNPLLWFLLSLPRKRPAWLKLVQEGDASAVYETEDGCFVVLSARLGENDERILQLEVTAEKRELTLGRLREIQRAFFGAGVLTLQLNFPQTEEPDFGRAAILHSLDGWPFPKMRSASDMTRDEAAREALRLRACEED